MVRGSCFLLLPENCPCLVTLFLFGYSKFSLFLPNIYVFSSLSYRKLKVISGTFGLLSKSLRCRCRDFRSSTEVLTRTSGDFLGYGTVGFVVSPYSHFISVTVCVSLSFVNEK